MPDDKKGVTQKTRVGLAAKEERAGTSKLPAFDLDDSRSTVVSDGDEETRVYDPKPLASKLPTSKTPSYQRPPPSGPIPSRIPIAPRVPADIAAAARSSRPHVSPKVERIDDSDQTRGYTAGMVEELLRNDGSEPTNLATSAADDDTHFGQVPIEELAKAAGLRANNLVGHDDPTKAYSLDSASPDSEDTIRANRAGLRKFLHEAPVIVQPELPESPRPRRRLVPLLGVVIAVAAATVAYGSLHGPIHLGRQLKAGFANPALTASTVTVSISASPADARIVLDGVQVTNPFLAQIRPDKSVHELTVDAPGYTPVDRKVQFERDITVVMALAAVPPAAVASQPGADGLAVAPAGAGEAMVAPPSGSTVAAVTSPSVADGEPTTPVSKPLRPTRTTVSSKAAAVATRKGKPVATNNEIVNSPTPPPAGKIAKPVGSANCNPPYMFDESNTKIFKLECL